VRYWDGVGACDVYFVRWLDTEFSNVPLMFLVIPLASTQLQFSHASVKQTTLGLLPETRLKKSIASSALAVLLV
jgi:hypothetical protein